MVKGTAIKKHLKVIKDFLPDWLAPLSQVVKQEDGDGGDGNGNGNNSPDGPKDVELGSGNTEALHQAQLHPTCGRYGATGWR